MMNTKKQKLFLAALALVAALGLTACSSKNETKAPKAAAPEATGGVFSSMETTDLDGNTADSSIFADQKLTFVNTWNVGCTPCVMELPILNQLNEEYADKGVAFKGLYYTMTGEPTGDARTEIENVLSDAGVTYQQLFISEAMAGDSTLANLQALPATFIVNSDGEIIDMILGSNDYDGWKATIDKYLAQVETNE